MNTNDEKNTQRLSVEEWLEMTKQGYAVPLFTRLHGNSMEPMIHFERERVKILPVYRELKIGDIVLFRREDDVYTVHRVWQISAQSGVLQTWGDNCAGPDTPVPLENILGIVAEVEKDGKWIALDTEEQRARGRDWMNSPLKRKSWMEMRRLKKGIAQRVHKLLK